jgi:hypothetical protein
MCKFVILCTFYTVQYLGGFSQRHLLNPFSAHTREGRVQNDVAKMCVPGHAGCQRAVALRGLNGQV